MCGSTKALSPNLPVGKATPALVEPYSCLKLENRHNRGKLQLPVVKGRPTEKELSSAEYLGGRGEKGLASDFVDETLKGEFKPGLLVVLATIKGFEKPWSILIDSGASGNYARRWFLEENQQYAEGLKGHDGDRITVRLATGVRVTVP